MSVRLTQAAVEIERHVSDDGWDQPTRLFALVDTAELVRTEPSLADTLGTEVLPGTSLTPIEQEDLPDDDLDSLLAQIAWPDEVDGVAIVLERLMLPPAAEDELKAMEADGSLHEGETYEHVAGHPDRQELRIVVAVLRDGSRECVLRLRARDDEREVLSGPDLVPELASALAQTFE
jgi:hypothetical protein